MRPLLFAAFAVAIGCASAPEPVVRLTVDHVTPPGTAPLYAYEAAARLGATADHPNHTAQAYSLLGREDLIAQAHMDYRTKSCPALDSPRAVLDEIVRRAADTRVVIINEAHSRSETRRLTGVVAEALAPLGYTLFGAEAFAQHRADALADDTEPYLEDADGYYVQEATFGRMLRRVRAAGYAFMPYEIKPDQAAREGADMYGRLAAREAAQAANVAAILEANPGAKLLLHVGYDHAREAPASLGSQEVEWFARRFEALTGIDPLTVSQTSCTGGSGSLVGAPTTLPAGTFDLHVDLPSATFTRARPAWRVADGDVLVDIPEALRPTDAPHVIEARRVGEPDEAIPMDRVYVRPGEDVALALPPGDYRVRAVRIEANAAAGE